MFDFIYYDIGYYGYFIIYKMMKKALTIAVGVIATVSCAFPKADLVKSLDQMPDLSFGLYSGYVPINGT